MRKLMMIMVCALMSVPACARSQPTGQATTVEPAPIEAVHATPESVRSWRRVMPSGVLGARLREFLEVINDGAAHEPLIDEAFYEHTTPERLDEIIAEIRTASGGVLRFERVLRVNDRALGVELMDVQNIVWTAALGLAEGGDRLEALDLQPVGLRPEGAKVYDTWDEALTDVRALTGDVGFAVRRIGKVGLHAPLALHGQDRVLNVAQLGQMYTLGALARAVSDGALSWDDQFGITAFHRSIPPSAYAMASEDATFSLGELTRGMGALRDSAAADAVFHTVGRDAIHDYYEAVTDGGHEATAPFMSMRDFALLKLFTSDDARVRYAEGDLETRSDMLAGVPDDADLSLNLGERLRAWREPRAVDAIGWFASPDEVVRTLIDLRDRAARGEMMLPLAEAMLAKPRNPLSDEVWPGAVLKSGGEPGVFASAWLLRRYDGPWFCAVLVVNDPDGLADASEIGRIMLGVADLLALED